MPALASIPVSPDGARVRSPFLLFAASVLGCALIGASQGQAADQPAADPAHRWEGSSPSGNLQPTERRNVVLAPGSPIAIPMVVSSQADGGETTSTTLYVSNHSDSATTATFQFRGEDGAGLEMPVSTEPGGAMASAVEFKSSHEVALSANGTARVVIRHGTASKEGWAEVTTSPVAAVSVTAAAVRTTGAQQDFNEIPSTPSYRRAWLVVDRTGGDSTDLVLVNSGSDEALSFHLNYRSGATTCEASAEAPAMGRKTVSISTSLACSSGLLGTVEINATGSFTGIARVSLAGQSDTFIRSLTGLPSMSPEPLEAWTVTDGGVQFEHLSSADCIALDARMLVGVSYTVHRSVWQARADDGSEWADLTATETTGRICAYGPSEPGEYRGVAEVTIDGVPGLNSSSNTVAVTAPTTVAGGYPPIPSFVVSEESVQFGSLSGGACVSSPEPFQVDWVTYEIHSSKWQTRANATSAWTDVEGTAKTGEICAHDPETPGHYRAVAEISRNGVRGTYVSSNVLTEDPPPPEPTGPAAQPGAEECSDLVGCFIPLPAGSFRMGSDSADADADETPLTRVTISEGVQLAKYELTHAQWELIMGPAAAYVESDCEETCPMVAVAFLGITEIKIPVFLQLLNQRDTEFTYRLPTEAEWEYAARAGTTGDRYGNLDDIAWHSGNSDSEGTPRIQPVGQKQANAWGFYDMLGNVYEWVQDRYGTYPGGTVTDPTGPTSGSARVARGGSFLRGESDARAPNRQRYGAGQLAPHLGLRLARVRN